ncbi:peptidoglycan-binding domain-containing protein [Marinobacter lutaoensis]|jgi:peptidoglycan hydrolase-like protein with peptidoglycan-binding domain|uniref:peptidoglycan-binding domain-containing protein n=1 Tax=Marinobacter lutaoensis TaxID=135739 RepID=UPI000C0A30E7|nr:peptidoglycan-binding domain-containing protein [Marinobacter lutaoensis]MBE01528.1 peptidoglycan-binding protein [Marinobacter sp.]MBI43708.1 peptidoglycan-binding protein [Oceanospirillales bacterium]NVD35256.1 peptidoglycan-binding protein [Marinobacter lutaoensis]|tara:strand:- start:9270 stop:9674 length:405 start_codon:yes stop_codon:yes gene_type:complete
MSNIRNRLRPALGIAGLAALLALAPLAHADEVVALKNALYGAGYPITNVSSEMDDATRSALTRFQKDHGLQATGILNEETKKALGMVPLQVVAASAPKPTVPAETAAAQVPAAADAGDQPGAIEEKDDGGWSLW